MLTRWKSIRRMALIASYSLHTGVLEHGMSPKGPTLGEQTGTNGNLGDPVKSHTESEYVVQVIIKRGRQKRGRKSDDCVVPMKVGNAIEGKAITITTMLWRNI